MSPLYSHRLALLTKVETRVNALRQTNSQQADTLAELRQQTHSDLCECTRTPATSRQALLEAAHEAGLLAAANKIEQLRVKKLADLQLIEALKIALDAADDEFEVTIKGLCARKAEVMASYKQLSARLGVLEQAER